MRRTIAILTLSCLLLSGVPRPGGAAVNVSRTGSENPMVEVARSIIWGGVAGLVVGSAMALASNGDNSGDIIKWSFVGGTFLWLGFGIYHVTIAVASGGSTADNSDTRFAWNLGGGVKYGFGGFAQFLEARYVAVRAVPGFPETTFLALSVGIRF